MASRRLIAWTEALAWVGIYGGLFALVLAQVEAAGGAAGELRVLGAVALVAGIALILVRSRLRPPADPSTPPQGTHHP